MFYRRGNSPKCEHTSIDGTLRYFEESALSCTEEAQSATDGHASLLKKKTDCLELVCDMDYSLAVTKYLSGHRTTIRVPVLWRVARSGQTLGESTDVA